MAGAISTDLQWMLCGGLLSAIFPAPTARWVGTVRTEESIHPSARPSRCRQRVFRQPPPLCVTVRAVHRVVVALAAHYAYPHAPYAAYCSPFLGACCANICGALSWAQSEISLHCTATY